MYRRRDYKRRRIESSTFVPASYRPLFPGCNTILHRPTEEYNDYSDSQSHSDESEFDDPAFWPEMFEDEDSNINDDSNTNTAIETGDVNSGTDMIDKEEEVESEEEEEDTDNTNNYTTDANFGPAANTTTTMDTTNNNIMPTSKSTTTTTENNFLDANFDVDYNCEENDETEAKDAANPESDYNREDDDGPAAPASQPPPHRVTVAVDLSVPSVQYRRSEDTVLDANFDGNYNCEDNEDDGFAADLSAAPTTPVSTIRIPTLGSPAKNFSSTNIKTTRNSTSTALRPGAVVRTSTKSVTVFDTEAAAEPTPATDPGNSPAGGFTAAATAKFPPGTVVNTVDTNTSNNSTGSTTIVDTIAAATAPKPSRTSDPRVLRSNSSAATTSSALPTKTSKTKWDASPSGKKNGNKTTTATKKKKNGKKFTPAIVDNKVAGSSKSTSTVLRRSQRKTCGAPMTDTSSKNSTNIIRRHSSRNQIISTMTTNANDDDDDDADASVASSLAPKNTATAMIPSRTAVPSYRQSIGGSSRLSGPRTRSGMGGRDDYDVIDSSSCPSGPSTRSGRRSGLRSRSGMGGRDDYDVIGASSCLSGRHTRSDTDGNDEDVCDQEYNRKEYDIKRKKDFRQSTPQELSAWKKKNASSTTTYLSKAPQNVQDEWKKIKQICDDCPSKKLDVWVDGTYLLLVLMLLLLLLLLL